MTHQIFLATNGSGISRARKDPDESWQVERLLEGLPVTCLAADPANPQVVYAGSRQRGVWRSTDSGQTWQAYGLEEQEVMSLAVSPHDPNVIYAGAKGARMFRSDDGGRNWQELEGFLKIPNRWWWFSPAEPPDRRPYVIAIAPSPTETGLILAGVEFGAVVRSEDGGESWSRHRQGALRDCHTLKFHASDGNWVYQAGGTGGGAAFSRDGGRTFQRTKQGLAKHYGITCAADAVKPEVWYVCVASGPGSAYGENPQTYLYRSTGGAGWQPVGWEPHPLPATPIALVTPADAPGYLFAGLTNGDIWQTADYGDSWEKLPINLGGMGRTLILTVDTQVQRTSATKPG